MRKLLHLSVVSAMAVFSFSSCKKDEQEELNFVNRAPQEVTFDVYGSMADYMKGEAPVLRKVIAPNDKLLLPSSTLAEGKTYYIDWYNEDHTLNNWFNDEYANGVTSVAFTPRAGARVYYTSDGTKSAAKNAFLNGSGTSTTWLAVDAFQYSNSTGFESVWNLLPNAERYHTILVRKDFTATHQFKMPDGTMQEENVTFKVHNASVGYIELYDRSGANIGYMLTGRSPYGAAPDYASNSLDSVLATVPNSEMQFLMVKQK